MPLPEIGGRPAPLQQQLSPLKSMMMGLRANTSLAEDEILYRESFLQGYITALPIRTVAMFRLYELVKNAASHARQQAPWQFQESGPWVR